MVRKSVLVYDLLKSEKRDQGLTESEIVNRLQVKYGFTPGKGIRRQINVALRRGLDYGILVKKIKKYRFDPDSVKMAPRKKNQRKKRKTPAKRRTKDKIKTNNRSHQRPDIPTPTVPRPPNWTPKRRNLLEEPVSKVIKHLDNSSS